MLVWGESPLLHGEGGGSHSEGTCFKVAEVHEVDGLTGSHGHPHGLPSQHHHEAHRR